MAQAGCHTPDCLFTGGPLSSTAAKGPCTDTAGYISNAEIQQIINTPGRVNYNYVDKNSDSNILVYDNNQWVGWMSPETKAKRMAIYQFLQMGGTSEWAVDLQAYHSAPSSNQPNDPGNGGADKWWSNFKETASRGGGDPGPIRGGRTGNWTRLLCSDRSIYDWDNLTPAERWKRLDVNDAFADVVRVWHQDVADQANYTFSQSVYHTLHSADENHCESFSNGCQETKECTDFVGDGTGPAGYLLVNSFVLIHRVNPAFPFTSKKEIC